MSDKLILIGFKACGKTSVGQYYAQQMHQPCIDTDRLIEERYHSDTGRWVTCAEIYHLHGERLFRRLEKECIATLLQAPIEPGVIATGGGSILDADNVMCLQQKGKLVYLYVTYETLLSRLRVQPRPAFLESGQIEANISKLYEQREPLYKNLADVEINTEGQSIAAIADMLRSL